MTAFYPALRIGQYPGFYPGNPEPDRGGSGEEPYVYTWADWDGSEGGGTDIFNTSTTDNMDVVSIDNNRVLVVYNGSSNQGYARVGTISSGSISYGTELRFSASTPLRNRVFELSSEKFVVVYNVGASFFAQVLTVSGTTVSAGSAATLATAGSSISFLDGARISNTEFIGVYSATSVTDTTAIYASVSGTTITVGNTLSLDSSNTTTRNCIFSIGNSQVVVCYANSTSKLTAKLLSVSGTTPVLDDTLSDVLGGDDVSVMDGVYISDGKAVFVAENTSSSPDEVVSLIFTVSGTTLSASSILTTTITGAPEYVDVCILNSTYAMVVSGLGTTGGVRCQVIDISGSVAVNTTSNYQIVDGDKEYVRIANAGTSTNAVVIYEDDNNSSRGTSYLIQNNTFSPYSLANKTVWLDAWDLRTITIATGVSQWDDKSDNSNNGTQSSGAIQPAYSNVVNRRNVLTFSSDQILLPAASTIGITGSEYEMVFVERSTDASNIQFIVANDTLADKEVHLNAPGARYIPKVGSSDYADIGSTGDYTDGNAHIIGVRNDNDTGIVRADGVDGVDTSATGTSSTSGTNYIIGARADGSFDFTGDLCEIIIFDRILSSTERSNLESHLAAKWGVTL